VDAQTFLGIERVDEGRWELEVKERLITPGQFLFGGCALAAGIVALEQESGRPTVWASAHYLSYAPTNSVVTVTTNLAVVGGNVTQARAIATIEDREILTINASLCRGTLDAPGPWETMPVVPPPLDCPLRTFSVDMGESVFSHIDTRIASGRSFQDLDGTPGSPNTALWARLPDHADVSAATLAIFGDYVSGGSANAVGRPMMGRSLDNSIRVAQIAPTEWVLCDIRMHALVGGFAQGTAFLWSEDGTLLATASQSIAAKLWDQPLPRRP